MSEVFEPGSIVWSAKYGGPAKIIKQVSTKGDYLGFVYQIYVLESMKEEAPAWFATVTAGGFYAYQPAYDLGRLEHLEKYGVDLEKI